MHQIQATITALDAALKDAADANPVFLSTQEKAAAVVELGRIETRVEELRLRVLAVAQDVADEVGARDPGTWLVAQEIADSPTARRQLRLAQALEERPVVRPGWPKADSASSTPRSSSGPLRIYPTTCQTCPTPRPAAATPTDPSTERPTHPPT